ncbi:hypothetical protein [Gilliamella sp. BG7]|uniref:hypothetical protein n=1 Tax=unclassified Gilliamella TaxID=2685620 RepID=UPI0039888BB0
MFNNVFKINLDKYSDSEQKFICSKLSSFDETLLIHFDKTIKTLVEKRKKGWSNFLRRGISKIHRYNAPKLIEWNKLYGNNKQPLLRMFHRFRKHDHQKNELLLKYRERKNMRLNIRTERQEMYRALDLALLNFLDVDQFGFGLFEITCSIEMLAKTISIYRIDEKGHARYDTLLNAINDYENTKQIIVYREFDKEKKVYKPMRFWLTLDFFKARGYTEEELRILLKSREQYLYKKGLFSKAREKYQSVFLQRLDKAGVLNPPAKLVKKLLKIKNKLLDMHCEKEAIKRAKKQQKQAEKEVEEQNLISYHDIFHIYSAEKMSPIDKHLIMKKVSNKLAGEKDSEKYWLECLIESGWIPPN